MFCEKITLFGLQIRTLPIWLAIDSIAFFLNPWMHHTIHFDSLTICGCGGLWIESKDCLTAYGHCSEADSSSGRRKVKIYTGGSTCTDVSVMGGLTWLNLTWLDLDQCSVSLIES
jgi:hypothetical protein